MRLGIDFGTTRTVVAAALDGRYPLACFSTDEGYVDALPGLATLHPKRLCFGADAAREWMSPEQEGAAPRLLRSVKAAVSALPPDAPVLAGETAAPSALQLTTGYLRYLRRMLVYSSNLDIDPQEPLEVMVAVPAHASTQQRYLTLEAFTRAGFEVLGLISEPTAAAIEYAHNSQAALSARSPKRYVVVYDLGGGTFDAAAVSLRDRRFDLIGAEGIARLGGNDFDQLIARQVLDQLALREDALSAAQFARLLECCRAAKETLGPNSRRLLVELGGSLGASAGEAVVLEAAPLYEAAGPLIGASLERLKVLFAQLAAHGIDPQNSRELGALYLVGGSVQFAPVQRLLRDAFGRKVQLAPQPHAATALGLAIAADPKAGIFVREAPTRHFGVWRETEAGEHKTFDAIIQKQRAAPLDAAAADAPGAVREYHSAHRVGELRFVECSQLDAQGQPEGEVAPWQRVFFPYDPALRDCSEQAELARHSGERTGPEAGQHIRESYRYGAEGMIHVRVENLSAGYARDYVLGGPTGERGAADALTRRSRRRGGGKAARGAKTARSGKATRGRRHDSAGGGEHSPARAGR